MLKTLVLLASNRYRQAQISFLQSVPELDLLEPAEDSQTFWQILYNQHPDLVILDESIFGDPDLALLTRLKRAFPQIACLVFAEKHQHMERASAAGANRVLLRGFSAKEFFHALEGIHQKRF